MNALVKLSTDLSFDLSTSTSDSSWHHPFLRRGFSRKTNWKNNEPKIIQFSRRLLREPDGVFVVGHQFWQSFNQLASAKSFHHRTKNPNERKIFWTEMSSRKIWCTAWLVCLSLSVSSLSFGCLLIPDIPLQWNWQSCCLNQDFWGCIWIVVRFCVLLTRHGEGGGRHARQQLARCGHPEGELMTPASNFSFLLF